MIQQPSVTRSNDGYAWGGHYNVDRPYGVNGLNQLTSAGSVALSYDGRGNLTASGASVYGYDLDDHLSAITDEADASRSLAFTHDAADRLSRVTLAAGATRREDYLHDANGNRTAVERRALPTDAAPTSTDAYSRTSGTNRIASIATASGTRTFTHDARGNLAGEARPGGVSVTAGYDGFGRLTSYVQSGQPALAMTYNGHDERVTLTRGTAAVRRFIHDPDGRVIGEYTGGPTTPIAEYIWLLPETDDGSEAGGDDGLGGWHPLAVVTADGAGGAPTLLWLHGNHLGVPQLATNAAGASVAMTNFSLPGFPGQLQTLPDLYYNQHRDYDPTTGRYLQADPIGLAGDPNPYTYAGANPVGMVDPEGWQRRGRGRVAAQSDWCGSEGFGWVPEGNWGEACAAHDRCYGQQGSVKEVCDAQLAISITIICALPSDGPTAIACAIAGFVYGTGLIFSGWPECPPIGLGRGPSRVAFDRAQGRR